MQSDQDRAAAMAREVDLDALLAEWDDRDAGYVGVLPRSVERLHFNDLAALIRDRLLSARRAGRREGLAKAEALCIDLASDDCSAGYAARRIAALRQQEAPDAE